MQKVLIIDENPTIIELVKYTVNLQGAYQVITVYDRMQGLERVVAEQPACVIIDVRTPHLDGYRVIHGLRSDIRTATIPLIILSDIRREEDQVAKALLSGTDEYLTKPFKPAALHTAIKRAVGSD